MKSVSQFILMMIIMFLIVGCNHVNQISTEETLGSIKELAIFLPDENAIWSYKGTGTYYHQMTLEDIISSNQSINYKIKAEILSDQKNSKYNDYLTEIRYILSEKGWQQELKQSKLLDSKYKGMYLIKFPIELNNTWQEKVLDFENKQHIITSEIQEIDFVDDQTIITVKYSENNSDYYEIRKFKQKKGIIEFKQNVKINQENIILGYTLENFRDNDDSIKSEVRRFLVDYNDAWEKYYNNEAMEILDFIEENSTLSTSILTFNKSDETSITFLDVSVESIQVNNSQYEVNVEESFGVSENGAASIQRNTRKYTIIRENETFKILKIE